MVGKTGIISKFIEFLISPFYFILFFFFAKSSLELRVQKATHKTRIRPPIIKKLMLLFFFATDMRLIQNNETCCIFHTLQTYFYLYQKPIHINTCKKPVLVNIILKNKNYNCSFYYVHATHLSLYLFVSICMHSIGYQNQMKDRTIQSMKCKFSMVIRQNQKNKNRDSSQQI